MESTVTSVPIACPGHSRPLAEVNFACPEGAQELLISACHDKLPMLRLAATGEWVGTFAGHKGAVWSAKLDKSTAALAATGSGDFTAKLWCAVTGRELHTFQHNHVVKTVEFAPNYDVLATGGQEGKVRLFSLATQELAQEFLISATDKIGINKCLFVDEHTIATGTNDGVVRLFDTRGGNMIHAQSVCGATTATVMDLQLSRDGSTLTAAANNYVTLLNSKDLTHSPIVSNTPYMSETGPGVIRMPDRMHFRDEGGAALHPDGRTLLAGASDLWVREFDVATGEELRCLKGHHGPVRCAAYSTDGSFFATGSEDGTIRIWHNSKDEENDTPKET